MGVVRRLGDEFSDDVEGRLMHLTLYRGARNPVPIEQTDFDDWQEVVDAIKEIAEVECEDKVNMLAFAPHKLKRPYRLNKNVEEVTMIVLDVDRVPDLEELLANIEAYGQPALVYESPSSTPEAPRVRIVIQTCRAMTSEECAPARYALAEVLGLEPGCGVEGAHEPARIFFAGRLKGTPTRKVWEFGG